MTAVMGQLLVGQQPDLDQEEHDDRELKPQPHAEDEMGDKADVIVGAPVVPVEAEQVRILDRGAQRDRQHDKVGHQHAGDKKQQAPAQPRKHRPTLVEIQRRHDEAPEQVHPGRRGDDQRGIKRNMKGDEKTLRRPEVVQAHLQRVLPGAGRRREQFEGGDLLRAHRRGADLEHGVRCRPLGQPGELFPGNLVGTQPGVADLEAHRRVRLVEKVDAPQRILEHLHDLVREQQAHDQGQADDHAGTNEDLTEVFKMLPEGFLGACIGRFRTHWQP